MQNIVILAGNIGQDPEARTTQGGTRITHFTLATSRPRYSEGKVVRDAKGYRVQDTEWHRITAFNGLGKTIMEHCGKGMKVLVRGRIALRLKPQILWWVADLGQLLESLERAGAPLLWQRG